MQVTQKKNSAIARLGINEDLQDAFMAVNLQNDHICYCKQKKCKMKKQGVYPCSWRHRGPIPVCASVMNDYYAAHYTDYSPIEIWELNKLMLLSEHDYRNGVLYIGDSRRRFTKMDGTLDQDQIDEEIEEKVREALNCIEEEHQVLSDTPPFILEFLFRHQDSTEFRHKSTRAIFKVVYEKYQSLNDQSNYDDYNFIMNRIRQKLENDGLISYMAQRRAESYAHYYLVTREYYHMKINAFLKAYKELGIPDDIAVKIFQNFDGGFPTLNYRAKWISNDWLSNAVAKIDVLVIAYKHQLQYSRFTQTGFVDVMLKAQKEVDGTLLGWPTFNMSLREYRDFKSNIRNWSRRIRNISQVRANRRKYGINWMHDLQLHSDSIISDASDDSFTSSISGITSTMARTLEETFKNYISELTGLKQQIKIAFWVNIAMELLSIILFVTEFATYGWSTVRFLNLSLCVSRILLQIGMYFGVDHNKLTIPNLQTILSGMTKEVVDPVGESITSEFQEYIEEKPVNVEHCVTSTQYKSISPSLTVATAMKGWFYEDIYVIDKGSYVRLTKIMNEGRLDDFLYQRPYFDSSISLQKLYSLSKLGNNFSDLPPLFCMTTPFASVLIARKENLYIHTMQEVFQLYIDGKVTRQEVTLARVFSSQSDAINFVDKERRQLIKVEKPHVSQVVNGTQTEEVVPPKKKIMEYVHQFRNQTESQRRTSEGDISKSTTSFLDLFDVKRNAKEQKVEYEKHGFDVSTWIRGFVGIVAVGLTIATISGSKGIGDFQKNFVNGHRFQTSLTESVKGVQDMVETISSQVFHCELSPYAKLIVQIKEEMRVLDLYRVKRNMEFASDIKLLYEYRDAINKARNMMDTMKTSYSTLPANVVTPLQMMQQCLVAANAHYVSIVRDICVDLHRVETLPIHIVGLPGAGKTWFTTKYLMPAIAKRMGYKTEVYNVCFAGQEKYWPPYRGQEMAFMDEFLGLKEECPMVSHLNALCSTGYYNMPGAQIEHKTQPCGIHALFLLSNRMHVNLTQKVTPEYETAFYHRLRRFQFVNKDQEASQTRDKIKHVSDYSNIEIRYFDYPADSSASLDTTSQLHKKMTVEEMVDMICDMLKQKEEEYKTNKAESVIEVESHGDTSDHYVYLFTGKPGTGKTCLTRNLATQLSKLLMMDIYDITVQDLATLTIPTRPSIIVMHDRLADEAEFVRFYDIVPKPSIFLLSSNGEVHVTSWLSTDRWTTRGNSHDSIASKAATLVHNLQHPPSYYMSTRQVNQEPGFIRRIGITGKLQHCGTSSFRSHDTGSHFVMNSGFICKQNDGIVTNSQILSVIYGQYIKALQEGLTIDISQAETLDLTVSYDVVLECRDTQELFELCASDIKMFKAWQEGKKPEATRTKPFVTVSDRVVNSDFTLSTDMFRLVNTKNIEEYKNMAMRTYATLRRANMDFTCAILTSDFKAVCSKGNIRWQVSSNLKHDIAEIVTRTHNNSVQIGVARRNLDSTETTQPKMWYNRDYILSGLLNGFQYIPYVSLNDAQTFLTYKERILNSPANSIKINELKMRKVAMRHVDDEKVEHALKWKSFLSSPLYKVVLVLCVVILSVGTICSLVGVIKWIYDKFQDKKNYVVLNGIPQNVIIDGQSFDIQTTLKGKEVSFFISTSEQVPDDVDAQLQQYLMRSCNNNNYVMGEISMKIAQSSYTRDYNKRKKTDKTRTVPTQKYLPLNESLPQGGNALNVHQNDMISLRTKLRHATVFVTSSAGIRSFGLRPKGRYVLTPSHLWNKVGEKGTVVVPVSAAHVVVTSCVVKYVDSLSDIAMCVIDDKRIPEAADITKFFHRAEDSHKIHSGMFMRMNSKKASADPEWYKLPIEYYLGPIERRVTRASTDGDMAKHVFTLEHYQGAMIPSVAGDCGQPYLCTQTELGHQVILGLHLGANRNKAIVVASAIDYASLINIIRIVDSVQVDTPKDLSKEDVELHSMALKAIDFDSNISVTQCFPEHPDMDKNVELVLDEQYTEWFDALENAVSEDDTIWYDAENNPESKLLYVGYDKNFRPSHLGRDSHVLAPWSEDISFPNLQQLSVVSLKQLNKEQIEQLPTLDGKKSILGQQISYYNDPCKWTPGCDALMKKAHLFLFPRYMQLYGGCHRVLTEREVVNGLYFNVREQWYQGLEMINMQASAGDYAHRFHGITSNKDLFAPIAEDKGKYIYNWRENPNVNAVKQRYFLFQSCAMNGTRLLTPCKDNLKREVTKPGKARCFQSMAIEETLTVRKYYGTFMAAVTKNYDRAYCQVGIDPFVEMHQLVKRFKRVSCFGEAGDFTRWDKHLMPQLIRQVMQTICAIITNSMTQEEREMYTDINKVITHCIIHTLCIADGCVYFKMKGNPSGNVLTSVLNSMVNDYMNVMFFFWKVKSVQLNKALYNTLVPSCLWQKKVEQIVEKLFEETDWADYGDDFVQVVNKRWENIVNFAAKQEFFQQVLGIKYDTPDKDGKTYKLKDVTQLGFLSRTFIESNGIVTPRLKKESIYSLFHWTVECTPSHTRQLMQDAFQELSLYDQSTYEEGIKNFHIICMWYIRRGMRIDFQPLPYKDARLKALEMICNGRQDSTTENPAKIKVDIGKSSVYLLPNYCDYFTEEIELHCDMDPQTVCEKLDEAFAALNYQEPFYYIDKYRAFPAYIETNNSGNYYSVVFDLKTQDDIDFSHLQSDVDRVLNEACFPDFKVQLRLCTVVLRKLPSGFNRAAQIHFNVRPVTLRSSTPNLKASLKKLSLNDKCKTVAQASGTDATPSITAGTKEDGPNLIKLPVQDNKVHPSALQASLWKFDMKQLAHSPMETLNSPIRVAINTPNASIVDIVSLGELGVMSPAMRLWAAVNSVTNATMKIRYEFVTASTIINSLRVGIVAERKASYTPQELQLIKWYDLSPQSLEVEFALNLAATRDDQNLPNRYTFSETIANGTKIPTLVMMTRTLIQNSFLNDTVSINMKRYMWFENDTGGPSAFRATADDLNQGFPSSSVMGNARSRGGQVLSTLLNLEHGRPFNLTLDGGYSGRKLLNIWRGVEDYKLHDTQPLLNLWDTERNENTSQQRLRGSVSFCTTFNYDGQVPSSSDIVADKEYQIDMNIFPFARVRRQLVFTHDQAGLLVPCLINRPRTYNDRSISFLSQWTNLMGTNNASNDITTVEHYVEALAAFEHTEPRVFFVMSSLNDLALPSAGLTISQRTDLNANPQVGDYWNDFWSQYKEYLVKTGWDVTLTDIETEGMEIYSRHSDARFYGTYKPSANNGHSTMVRVETVNNRTVETFRTPHLWTQGSVKKLIKFYHPIHGNRAAIVVSRNSQVQSAVVVNQLDHRVVGSTMQYDATAYGSGTGGHQITFSITGNLRLDAFITNAPELTSMITRVNDIVHSGEMTLHPDQTRLVFASLLPSTIPETIATSNASVEINDPVFMSAWINWLANQHVPEDALVTFELSNIANIHVFAFVGYDVARRFFFVVNQPVTTADRYRVYPKLTFEDVVILNFTILPSEGVLSAVTNTRQWIDRVVPNTSKMTYNGQRMTTLKTSVSKLIRATTEAHAELAMAAAGVGGGALQSLAQVLGLFLQYKQMNEIQKRQFEHDMEMIKARTDSQLQVMKYQSAQNSLQSPVAQNSMAQSGTQSSQNDTNEMNIQSPAALQFLQNYKQAFQSGGIVNPKPEETPAEVPTSSIGEGDVGKQETTPLTSQEDGRSMEQQPPSTSAAISNLPNELKEQKNISELRNKVFSRYDRYPISDEETFSGIIPSRVWRRSPKIVTNT